MMLRGCTGRAGAAASARAAPIRLQASRRPTLQLRSTKIDAPTVLSSEAAPSLVDRAASAVSATFLALAMVAAPAFASAPAADISNRAVEEYQALESKGKISFKSLDEFRSKYKMKRTTDGRVQLKSTRGDWWSVRLDMEVPGALLLRSPDGKVFAVQTDSLQQIDLSDDYVCLLMFADGAWEETMTPIEYSDESGKTLQLRLDEKEFREVIGILKETAEDLDGQQ